MAELNAAPPEELRKVFLSVVSATRKLQDGTTVEQTGASITVDLNTSIGRFISDLHRQNGMEFPLELNGRFFVWAQSLEELADRLKSALPKSVLLTFVDRLVNVPKQD